MINSLLFDFSRVLLFPKDKSYSGKLNDLYREIVKNPSYNFFNYFELNDELFSYIKTLVPMFSFAILTTDIIQNDKSVKKHIDKIFSRVFSAKDLGVSKKQVEAYSLISQKLKIKPSEIVFIDDTKENLAAASQAGLHILHFVSNQKLFKELTKILSKNS